MGRVEGRAFRAVRDASRRTSSSLGERALRRREYAARNLRHAAAHSDGETTSPRDGAQVRSTLVAWRRPDSSSTVTHKSRGSMTWGAAEKSAKWRRHFEGKWRGQSGLPRKPLKVTRGKTTDEHFVQAILEKIIAGRPCVTTDIERAN